MLAQVNQKPDLKRQSDLFTTFRFSSPFCSLISFVGVDSF